MRSRSTTPMHAAKIGYIVISAALCILGIMLIAIPDFSASLFGVICGILLILFGIVRLFLCSSTALLLNLAYHFL